MSAIREATFAVADAFPEITVVPVIGNNDPPFHYQGPTDEKEKTLKKKYYTDLYKMWVHDITANKFDSMANQAIFGKTGSFKAEIASNLYVLSLNTLYWGKRMHKDSTEA